MKKSIQVALLASVMGLSTSVLAGGYQLNEYSVTGLGRAFAGAGIVGDDYSAIAFNPAGMSLKDSGVQGGATVIQLKSDVKDLSVSGHNPGTIRLYSPLPHFFGQYKVNDSWRVGFGIYTPFGLATRYKSNWFGSTTGIESALEIVDFAPAVSYKFNNHLSVGATVIARYIHGKMTNNVRAGIPEFPTGGYSVFDLDGWTMAGVLGMMYEFNDDSRIGLSWRSKSAQQVKGSHKLKNYTVAGDTWFKIFPGSTASPDLPETFTLSGFHKVSPKIGLSATAKWTHWSSSFEEFVLNSSMGSSYTSPYKWENTWTLTAGLDYYYNQNWTFRVGTGWDESPSHNDDARTVRIPDNDRIWASVGFSYTKDNFQWDVGYSHMFMKTAIVHETNTYGEKINAKYDSQGNLLGVALQYNF